MRDYIPSMDAIDLFTSQNCFSYLHYVLLYFLLLNSLLPNQSDDYNTVVRVNNLHYVIQITS